MAPTIAPSTQGAQGALYTPPRELYSPLVVHAPQGGASRIRPRRGGYVARTGAKTVETATVNQIPKLLIKTVQLYKDTGAETHRDVCRQSTQNLTLG